MGKIDLPLSNADAPTTGIAVRPVLLRKGNTRLGMYGIGNVKDQRMHFELRSNRVRMFMPTDKDKWFNMLLLHQNRCANYVVCLIAVTNLLLESNMARKSSFRKAYLTTMSTWSSGDTNTTAALFQNQ